jgi:DnaJ like chaperone protein
MTSLTAFTEDFLPWLRSAFTAVPRVQKIHAGVDQLAFQYAITALSAKVAAADGAATPSEYAVFETVFPFAGQDALKQRSLFVKHMNDRTSALQYARQIRGMQADSATRSEILRRLMQLANADAPMNAAELELLGAIAAIWGISREDFRTEVSKFLMIGATSPYDVLRVSRRASNEEIRARYMEQVRFLHPDQYHAVGASKETIAILGYRLAAVNAAFEAIAKQRGDGMKRAGSNARRYGLKTTKGANTP